MTTAIIIFAIISVLVAIRDINALIKHEKYFEDIPAGDLEFYERKKVLGLHNVVFFPSLLIIGVYLLIVRTVNHITCRS